MIMHRSGLYCVKEEFSILHQSLGRWLVLGFMKSSHEDVLADHKKRHTKFKESAWKCLYYFSAKSLALTVTYNEPWFTNTKKIWVGPGDQVWPVQKVKTKLKASYMYTTGLYTYGTFVLIFWETRRSDFGVSMAPSCGNCYYDYIVILAKVR